jgi:hypothetical protein
MRPSIDLRTLESSSDGRRIHRAADALSETIEND